MTEDLQSDERSPVNVFRVILIGTLLSVPFAFWLQYAELVLREGLFAVSSALPPPAIAGLFILALVHAGLKSAGRKHWLPREEVLLIYVFLLITVALASYGLIQQLVMHLAGGYFYASSSNDFALVLAKVPSWAAPQDQELIRKMFNGADADESYRAYMLPMIRGWLLPMLRWGLLVGAVYTFTWSLALVVEEQWSIAERLKFPLVTPPLELTAGAESNSRIFERGLLGSSSLKLGLLVSIFINGPSFGKAFYPDFPGLKLFWNTGFSTAPWSAGNMAMSYRPVALGIAFLAPTDVSLSIWVFEFFKSAQRIFGAALGLGELRGTDMAGSLARFPYHSEQAAGAFLFFAVLSLWMARKHVLRVCRSLAGKDHDPQTIRMRWACFGVLGSAAFIVVWLIIGGMFGGAVCAFLLVLVVLAVTYARIRASAGVPLYGIKPYRPDVMLVSMTGTSSYSTSSLAHLGPMAFLSMSYFPMLMATQLEGLKFAQETGVRRRDVTKVLFGALIVGCVVGLWTLFHVMYVQGADQFHSYIRRSPQASFRSAVGFMKSATGVDWYAISAVVAGFVISAGLNMCRSLYWFWPINPLGYAISQTPATRHMWGMFLLAWVTKVLVMRYGGVRLYRQSVPFFLGLIVGQMVLVIISNGLNIWLGTRIYVSAF
jgi:hypothetical protein